MTKQFIGMSARVFQHEYDHLMGLRFFDKANKFHRDQAMRKWKR
jgi:peptide deformylase